MTYKDLLINWARTRGYITGRYNVEAASEFILSLRDTVRLIEVLADHPQLIDDIRSLSREQKMRGFNDIKELLSAYIRGLVAGIEDPAR